MTKRRTRSTAPKRRWGIWTMTGVLVLMVLTVLTVSGLVSSSIGNDAHARAPEGHESVPAAISAGGPIIDARGDPVRSGRLPDRTVVLTFDDGPDPEVDPEDPGGARAATACPALLRDRRDGHPAPRADPADRRRGPRDRRCTPSPTPTWRYQSDARRTWELAPDAAGARRRRGRPQRAVPPAVLLRRLGARRPELRPVIKTRAARATSPSSSTTTPTTGSVPASTRSSQRHCPRSPARARWSCCTTRAATARRPSPRSSADPELQAEGYRFTTVSEPRTRPPRSPTPVTATALGGQGLPLAPQVAGDIMPVLVVLLAVVGFLVFGRFALMLVLARPRPTRPSRPDVPVGPAGHRAGHRPRPGLQRARVHRATVRSLVASDHPIEVIVIDDGSTDGTADIVEELALPWRPGDPPAQRRQVHRAQHRHRGRLARPHRDDGRRHGLRAVHRRASWSQPFADPAIGAVAGNAKVGNRDSLIGAWQHIEYVIGFNLDRRMYDTAAASRPSPARSAPSAGRPLQRVGGMSDDTLAEDTDITMALRATAGGSSTPSAPGLDRGPGTPRQLWSPALPLVLRHHAGDVEAPPRRARPRPGRPLRPARAALVVLFGVVARCSAPLVDMFLVYGLLFGDPTVTLQLWG